MLQIVTSVQVFLLTRAGTWRRDPDHQRGQATAEYALVLLAVAAVALVLITWASKSGMIGKLFSKVFDSLIQKIL